MKKNSSRAHTKRIALGASLSAMCFAALYIGAVLEVLDLSACLVASMVITVIVIEVGARIGWLSYFAVSVLSLVLLPYKLPALLFALFSGFYPMIKQKAEPLGRVLSWIIKLATFNVALTLTVILCEKVFSLGEHFFALSPLLYIGGNATFVLYDVALTRLISFYIFKLRKRMRIK